MRRRLGRGVFLGCNLLALMGLAVNAAASHDQDPYSWVKFAVEGIAGAGDVILGITVDDLVIDQRPAPRSWQPGQPIYAGSGGIAWTEELTRLLFEEAVKEGWRVSGPGDAHFGSITIRGRAGTGTGLRPAVGLYQWWLDCSQGKNIRKSISVIVHDAEGKEARRWTLLNAIATRWESEGGSPSGRATPPRPGQAFTLTLDYGGLDMRFTGGGDHSHVSNFKIEIDGIIGGGSGTDVDSAWETLAGGGVATVDESHFRDMSFHTATPGHRFVETLQIRGPLDGGRKALCDWITATVKGQPWKRSVTVKEILKDGSDGKTFTYLECYPVRYVFPAFDNGGRGNLYEEVHIKPIRLELAK